MKMFDSINLASQKFKVYKGRNIFSGCTISLGIILIMVILIIVSGLLRIVKKSFINILPNKQIVQFTLTNICTYFDLEDGNTDCNDNGIDLELFKEEHKDDKMINYYPVITLENLDVNINAYQSTTNTYSTPVLEIVDNAFIKDFIPEDKSFEDKYNGRIPVVITLGMITDKEFEYNDSKKSYLEKNKLYKDYLGKETVLEISDQNNNLSNVSPEKVNIVIVGILNSTYEKIIFVPNWALENNSQLKQYSKYSQIDTLYIEFKNKKDLNEFMHNSNFYNDSWGPNKENYTQKGMYTIYESNYTQVMNMLKILRGVGIGIGLFFLGISSLFIFFTINKLVSDSKKEIAIYRAIGARKKDIVKIILSYTFLLSTTGFIIGIILSYIIIIILSLTINDKLYYSLINYGDNLDLKKSLFMLFNVPILPFTVLYIFTIILGMLSSILPILKAILIQPMIAMKDD